MVEYFDIIDINSNFLNKTAQRGSELQKGEYHKVVLGIILNLDNKLLLTLRSENKFMGNHWETTAGSVNAGESSKDAIVREIKEEVGLTVSVDGKRPVDSFIEGDAIFDVWIFNLDFDLRDLTLDQSEVSKAMLIDIGELQDLLETCKTVKSLKEVLKILNKYKIENYICQK